MNIQKLRTLTIVGPVAFLVVLELISVFVFRPTLGNNSVLRLFIIFTILAITVVPFSFWVFAIIEQQQRDLRETATMLESVRDYGIFMLDPRGIITTWSTGAERVKGYTADEVIGRNVSIFYTPEDIERGLPEETLELAATRGMVETEGWRRRKDGTRFWANVVSTAQRDERGNVTGYTHVVRDGTERRQAEGRIRQLNAELERRVAELNELNAISARHAQELDAVNLAIRSISSAIDLDQVLQNIIDAARTLVHSRYAALGVADERGTIEKFITSGITQQQREAIGPLPVGHGLLGTLIKEGEPLRIPSIAAHPDSQGFPPNHPPMTSLLGVPILYQGKPVGDLYLTDKIGAEEFSQDDQDLLMLLANHAAIAIENARLYSEARTSRDRLQAWNRQLEAIVADRTREIERYSREMTTRVLRAQEEERKRIARELHDETAQSLSTLLINLDLVEPFIPPDNTVLKAGFERAKLLARRTLDETRALSHDLRPTILDDVGLVAALQWFADEHMKTFGVPVEVRAEDIPEERLDPDLEIALFRIAQEALNNSGKYADADWARVTLRSDHECIVLSVEDNGKGFDPEGLTGPTRTGGLGLYGMRERAELLGGKLVIQSSPEKGTRVCIETPVQTLAGGSERRGSES